LSFSVNMTKKKMPKKKRLAASQMEKAVDTRVNAQTETEEDTVG